MIQKCSILRILKIFFVEPTSIHFIREISRRINLATTSVRNNIKKLLKEGLVRKKKAKPFDGFVANRENDNFLFYKRVYNLYSLKGLSDFLINSFYPKLMVVFGSYSTGEDVETSDIDILILTKSKKEISLNKFEEKLKRKINLIIVDNLNKLDNKIKNKIFNGIVLYGSF